MTPNCDPFRGRVPLPTDDFLLLVRQQGLTDISLVSFWVRKLLQDLYYATAGSQNAFKMAMAVVINHVQAVFLALCRIDAAAWTGDSAIRFPVEHLRSSHAH